MAHPLDQTVTEDIWAPPITPPAPAPADIYQALPVLAVQGRWREIASRCREATPTDIADAMSIAAYHVLALIKLQMLEEAAAELGKLGGWDDPLLAAPATTAATPSSPLQGASQGKESAGASISAAVPTAGFGSATVVPFALRRMQAELPWWLGRQRESVDRLHQLLDWCAVQEAAAAAGATAGGEQATWQGGGSGTSGSAAMAQRLWARRHRDVLLTLVNRHCRAQQYASALRLLDRLLQRDAEDVQAWQEAGMVQALLGDAAAAAATLQRVEHLLAAGGGGDQEEQQRQQWRQRAVHRNKGLLCFIAHDCRGAAREYQAALALDPSDAAAAINHALALMHCNQLPDAVAALHAAFRRAPAAMLQEPVVTNLACLLELGASPATLAAKQRMAEWVHTAAPDDFDLSATKA